jgi:hypothetical protein
MDIALQATRYPHLSNPFPARLRIRLGTAMLFLSIFANLPLQAEVDVTTIEKFPPGNYLCNLWIHGKEQKLNFEVQGQELVCVNATERGMIGLRGKFELMGGNGVFLVQLRGGDFIASQFWVFKSDGSAVIKEVPDRGEKQRAVPVEGKTLER